MREKHLSFAQVNDIFGFRIVARRCPTATSRSACCTSLLKPVPGQVQDYIAIPEGQRLPVAAHHAGQPVCPRGGVQMRTSHERGGGSGVARTGCTKTSAAGNPGPQAPGRDVAAVAVDIQGETRDSAEFWDTSRSTCSPRRGLRLHALQDLALPRDAGGLRLRDPLRRRRPLRRCQRSTASRSRCATSCAATSKSSSLRARGPIRRGWNFIKVRAGPLADPPLPEDDGQMSRASSAKILPGAARRKAWHCRPATCRTPTPRSGSTCALERQPHARRPAHRHRPQAQVLDHRRQRLARLMAERSAPK